MPLWLHVRRRPFLFVACILVFFISVASFSHWQAPKPAPLRVDRSRDPTKKWSSWDDISTLFVFGDSWSNLGLKKCAQFTDEDDPSHFGNPSFHAETSTLGPNWVGYLTHVFNRGLIKTYDLAIAGASIDTNIVIGMWGNDFGVEIDEMIGPIWPCKYVPKTWDPVTTLFAVFFGINDVAGCIEERDCDIHNPPMTNIFKTYAKNLDTLYDAGARNFLLLNSPPISAECALDTSKNGSSMVNAQTRATKSFNEHHRRLAHNLRFNYTDTTVFEFDMWNLIQSIYHHPENVPEVAGIKNLNDICHLYSPYRYDKGQKLTEADIEACGGLKPEEYLWNSPLHVTWPVHKAMARSVVEVMDLYTKAVVMSTDSSSDKLTG